MQTCSIQESLGAAKLAIIILVQSNTVLNSKPHEYTDSQAL